MKQPDESLIDSAERQQLEVVESFEHQEWRARQEFSLEAALKAGFGLGMFFFALPGGSPWTGPGFATTVMGHAVQWPWLLILVAHFAVSIVYMTIIGSAVYRFQFLGALVTGLAIGAMLFAPSFILLAPWSDRSMVPLLGHIIYGAMGAVAYKALAVPPPYTRQK